MALLYFVLFTLLGLSVYILAPVFADQFLNGTWYFQMQHMVSQWQDRFSQLPELGPLLELSTQVSATVQTWVTELGRWAIGLSSLLLNGVLVLALAYFLAIYPNSLRRLVFDLLPEPYHRRAYHWSGLMGEQFVRWAWSQALLSLYIVITFGVGLYLLGVPYALLLALIGGVLEVIPYFGGVVTALLAVLLSLPYSLSMAVGAVIWYVIVNQVENYLLIPRLYERTMHLHPLLVLIAFMVGGRLLGLIGMLLAIPLAAAIQAAWEHRDRIVVSPDIEDDSITQDPVCGMHLAPELAHSSLIYGGQKYYFCSDRCHSMFLTWPVDPVCRQKVMPQVAERVTYQGKTYYFCDPVCARRFVKAPTSWLASPAALPSDLEIIEHTTDDKVMME
jgi:predicted PurR-regulated permease PerM/YHS domain-containing protein